MKILVNHILYGCRFLHFRLIRIKFKYADFIEDDSITERCLMEIKVRPLIRGFGRILKNESVHLIFCHFQDSLSRLFVASRDSTLSGEDILDGVSRKISIDNLLYILKTADNMETAEVLSEFLKEVWKAHVDSNLRWKLDTATGDLLGGKTKRALSSFSELVDEDHSYAEAWNKASTCEFMLGNMDASLAAARRSLECLPTHFQAQNGLGLVYYEKKDIPAAVKCFHKSMEIDPWSPVSARLSTCLDTLKLWNSTSTSKPN